MERPARDNRRQALSLDEIHREEVTPRFLADLMNRDDVSVPQSSRRAGLGLKTPHLFRRSPLTGEDHLECDDSIQIALPRLVDYSHPPAPDLTQQLVLAKHF